MENLEIPEASGTLASRKFILTVSTILLITAVSILAVWFPAIPAVLPTFIGGILGVLSLYMTGNIMNKYVVGKQLTETKGPETIKKEGTK
jgi:hypothetical protein